VNYARVMTWWRPYRICIIFNGRLCMTIYTM
jgi:hypothetical protein